MRNNKRGLSEVIGYVLLISISLTLATLVFTWLKGYLPSETLDVECDENIALTIRDFNYSSNLNQLNLTIQNRGLFNVDGYVLRVNNNSLRDLGVYTINRTGKAIQTGEVYLDNYIINSSEINGSLTLIEIQPILIKKGKPVYCKNFISRQRI